MSSKLNESLTTVFLTTRGTLKGSIRRNQKSPSTSNQVSINDFSSETESRTKLAASFNETRKQIMVARAFGRIFDCVAPWPGLHWAVATTNLSPKRWMLLRETIKCGEEHIPLWLIIGTRREWLSQIHYSVWLRRQWSCRVEPRLSHISAWMWSATDLTSSELIQHVMLWSKQRWSRFMLF